MKAEITARGESYDYELLARRIHRATREQQERLNVSANQSILAVQGRHLAGGRPFALEERIINLAAVPEAADADFSHLSPGTWLLDKIPWTEAEHHISAINADEKTARLLDVATDIACLVIERKTWRSSVSVTFARLTFLGALYRLFAHFTPAQRER